ncbi:MAG: rhomboid family intramembrane serine protease [Marinifilaceae bacterium]
MLTYLIIGVTAILSFVCFNNFQISQWLSLKPYNIVHKGQWYRIITHGFVHADWAHLLVNMITFWSFGIYMEQVLHAAGNRGGGAFLLLYFGGMIFATIPDIIRYRNAVWYASIGASGAVSAVLFAAIFINPWSNILFFGVIPIPGVLFGVLFLVYCKFMSQQHSDNINHTAHFLGAVYGFFLPGLLYPHLWQAFFNHWRT